MNTGFSGMDDFMDRAWEVIYSFLINIVVFIDTLLSPFEIIGAGGMIFLLAFFVVVITKIIGRFYTTKRFITLKKEFEHWKDVRDQAIKHPDKEKGKALAKNVDQAELNKAYYDYFFEGLLKNLVTTVIPILLMVTYITKAYTPATLLNKFGSAFIFSFSFGASSRTDVSSLLWFVISLLLSFVIIAILKIGFKRLYAKND